MHTVAKFILALALLTPAFAQSLRIALVTKDAPGSACEVPAGGASFSVDTPKLYAWFLIDNAVSGDRYRVQWVMPDGRVLSTVDFNPTTAGSFCFSTSFEPAAANRLTGLWSALIIRNGNQVLRSVDFQLTSNTTPTISQGGIAEPWTYQPGLSPGGWATLYGTNLATSEASWRTTPGRLLPTTLAGVTVRIDGTPVPLAFVSPGIVNFLAPGSLLSDQAAVTVERDGAISPPVTVSVRRLNPAIYSIADTSRSPAAFFVTAARAGASELVGNPAIDSRTLRGARPGESIDLYVTGLGRTSGDFPTDRMFSGAYPVLEPLTIDLNGVAITPEFAGLTSPGLYLVRFTVPQGTVTGNQPIQIKSGEFASAANVFLRIQDSAPPLTLESLTLSSATIVAGQSVTGTITLSGLAPAAGVPVQLSIDSGSPTTFTVAPNRNSVRFNWTPPATSPNRTVTFFARWNGMEKSAALTITAQPQTSPIQNYEITVNGSAVIEGRRATMKILLSVPDILPRALVDTLGDLASGIILYTYYFSPVITGDTVTFSTVDGFGAYSNIFGGVTGQMITGGSLTLTVPSAANGTPVTGTVQFRTATKNITTQFSGTVTASTRIR